MKKLLFILLLLLTANSLFAQPHNQTRAWGTYLNYSEITSIALDENENLWVLGNVNSFENFQFSNILTTDAHQPSFGGGDQDAFIAKFSADGDLLYASYFGGEAYEEAGAISIKDGKVYIGGATNSNQGIATSGVYQENLTNETNSAFVACFNLNGVLQWASYFQGNRTTTILEVSAGYDNDVFIWGTTSSNDLGTNGVFKETIPPPYTLDGGGLNYPNYPILARFNDSGQLLWATYYGQDVLSDEDFTANNYFSGLAVDDSNAVYVSGNSGFTDGFYGTPNTHQSIYGGGENDIFVAKFNENGQRIWGTYFGGDGNEGLDKLDILRGNQLYLTGVSTSTSAISTPNSFNTTLDGSVSPFVTKLSPDGQQIWGTYLAPTPTAGVFLGADDQNNVFIYNSSIAVPSLITQGSYQDEPNGSATDFTITKLDFNGQNLLWGTYYGGSQFEYASWSKSFAVSDNNELYLAGVTESTDMLTSENAFQSSFATNNQENSFIAKFTPCQDPIAPTGENEQNFNQGETLENLTVNFSDWTGSEIIVTWYEDEENTQEIPADTVLEENTTYYVTQTIKGCEESESLAITASENLGITNNYFSNVSIAPNPAHGIINIEKIPNGNIHFKIFNLMGKSIFSKTRNIHKNSEQIRINKSLPTGIYLLKLTQNKYSEIFKIVVE